MVPFNALSTISKILQKHFCTLLIFGFSVPKQAKNSLCFHESDLYILATWEWPQWIFIWREKMLIQPQRLFKEEECLEIYNIWGFHVSNSTLTLKMRLLRVSTNTYCSLPKIISVLSPTSHHQSWWNRRVCSVKDYGEPCLQSQKAKGVWNDPYLPGASIQDSKALP